MVVPDAAINPELFAGDTGEGISVRVDKYRAYAACKPIVAFWGLIYTVLLY
jgi:hypothetical protein